MTKIKSIRMRDVAARCGVSESIVSHVINHTKWIPPETPAGRKPHGTSVAIR